MALDVFLQNFETKIILCLSTSKVSGRCSKKEKGKQLRQLKEKVYPFHRL